MPKVTVKTPKKRGGKIDSESLTIIEQLTLLKLEYARIPHGERTTSFRREGTPRLRD